MWVLPLPGFTWAQGAEAVAGVDYRCPKLIPIRACTDSYLFIFKTLGFPETYLKKGAIAPSPHPPMKIITETTELHEFLRAELSTILRPDTRLYNETLRRKGTSDVTLIVWCSAHTPNTHLIANP